MKYTSCTVYQSTSPGEGSAFLSFRKGDLIELDNDDGEDVMKSGWCYGTCIRTNARGDFPAECVYVLPSINKPTAEILVSHVIFMMFPQVLETISFIHNYLSLQSLFSGQTVESAEKIIATTKTALESGNPQSDVKPHSLKEFALDHFRPPPKRTLSRSLSRGAFRRKGDNELWGFSRVSCCVHSRNIACCLHTTMANFSLLYFCCLRIRSNFPCSRSCSLSRTRSRTKQHTLSWISLHTVCI